MILAQIKALEADKTQRFTTLSDNLSTVQHLLFNIGGELAMPQYKGISESHISWLESEIDTFNEDLPALKDFILPAGSTLVSQVHIARTVCRRAERQAVNLQQINAEAISSNAPVIKPFVRLAVCCFKILCQSRRLKRGVMGQNGIDITSS